jgi:hypothetical protein
MSGSPPAHRYLMGRLPLHGFYLWRHVLSTAPPFTLWWWKFDPPPPQFPLHRRAAPTTNSNGTQPNVCSFQEKNMITCYHDNMIHRLTISRINYWNVRGFYRRHMVTLSCYHDNVIMFFSWKLHTLDTAFTFGEGVWGAVYIIFSYQCAPAPKRD